MGYFKRLAMDNQAQLDMIRQTLLPRLQDAGFEAFCITGYMRTSGDKIQRVCIAAMGENPAYEDGLRQMVMFANLWGGKAIGGPEVPPPTPQ